MGADMNSDLLVNLLDPPVLFFFLGLLAVALKSDLDIPQPLSKFFRFLYCAPRTLKNRFWRAASRL
jgi:hypothetical protein